MMLRRLLLFHIVLLSLYCCNAYKLLLVFPTPSRSHAILGEGYVKHLAKAGHEITYITPMPMKNPPYGVRQIDVSVCMSYMATDVIFDARYLIPRKVDLQDVAALLNIFLQFSNETLHIDEVQKLLRDPKEEFDAVIVEWLYTEMFAGLSTVFNCPLIWSSSMEAHSMVLSLINEYPNPAYTLDHLSRYYGFNFWQRAHQLCILFYNQFLKWTLQSYENQIYRDIYENIVKERGRLLPPYEEVRYNASLMFGNSHIATGEAISLPQNYKSIGGYHVEKEQESLPEHLKKIMDDAEQGVIYFSMGSILRSSRIPERLKRELLDVFGSLNQTVIWKLEEMLLDLPKNVHILSWAPQSSILAHSNCVLFITHGGLLSQTEAVHFGVPMIGIPQYADQFINTNRAESKGFAKRVDLYYDGARKLKAAIHEVLGNSSYRERIKEYSFIYHHRPVPPEKELVHWVEHVIKTRGAMHLRSPALRMPWYQKYYVDLACVTLLMILIIFKLYKQLRLINRSYLKNKQL